MQISTPNAGGVLWVYSGTIFNQILPRSSLAKSLPLWCLAVRVSCLPIRSSTSPLLLHRHPPRVPLVGRSTAVVDTSYNSTAYSSGHGRSPHRSLWRERIVERTPGTNMGGHLSVSHDEATNNSAINIDFLSFGEASAIGCELNKNCSCMQHSLLSLYFVHPSVRSFVCSFVLVRSTVGAVCGWGPLVRVVGGLVGETFFMLMRAAWGW